MRTVLRSIAPLLVLLALALPVNAQTAPMVAVGSTVRIASPAFSGVATVVAARPDTLQIVLEGLTAPVAIPMTSITGLERRRSASALERLGRGAVWGAGVMGAIGLLMVASVSESELSSEGEEAISRGEFVLFSATGGALWGSVIGLVIPQHRWARVR